MHRIALALCQFLRHIAGSVSAEINYTVIAFFVLFPAASFGLELEFRPSRLFQMRLRRCGESRPYGSVFQVKFKLGYSGCESVEIAATIVVQPITV